MIHDAEEFIRLRNSEDPAEYHRAAHDEARLEVWQDVITHYPDMRSWVAHNKTVPLEILAILASDPSNKVRYTVATKNKLPADLMLRLAVDEDAGVRQRIACNKKATTEALRLLAEDPWLETAEHAKKRLAERGL